MTVVEQQPRTYGNWRRPSTPGLPGLGTLGTVIALGGLLVTLLVTMARGLLPGAVSAVAVLVMVAPLAYRDRAGRNGWHVLTARVAWRWGRARGQHLYAASRVDPVLFGSVRLPGLLAASKLYEAVDGAGREFALLHVPATRHYSVLIHCDPEGGQLVDAATVDTWVANWGLWLARLGHEIGLVGASVTVETAPDPGTRLAAEVQRLLVDSSPLLSRAVLSECARTYPRGAPAVRAYATLTFSARRLAHDAGDQQAGAAGKQSRSAIRGPEEMAADIARRLPQLVAGLAGTGAGASRPLTVQEVCELVRVAYDPTAAGELAQRRVHGEGERLRWDGVGPTAALESWSSLRHDAAMSVTWQMVSPPRGAVQARVLEPLLGPSELFARKRVTVLYRPHDPAAAARIADADRRTAIGQDRGKAGESLSRTFAEQTAREQATGAGLVRFAVLTTGTVTDGAQLPAAAAVMEQLGSACQVTLRRAYGSQSASFAAALGVGLVLPAHVRVPAAGAGRAVTRRPSPGPAALGFTLRPGPRGFPGRGRGRVSYVDAPPEWRATTVQVCGLFPWAVGGGSPTIGVPLGPNLDTGATVCCDPLSWFETARLLLNPSMAVLGLPGLGKSSITRRMVIGLAGAGVTPLILGDLKPDYVDVVRALGGQIVRLGRGLGSLNVLEVGALDTAADRLPPAAALRLREEAHGRRCNALYALLTLVRGTRLSDTERTVLSAALRLLIERHRGGPAPLLQDLVTIIDEGPDPVRAPTLARGDRQRYLDAVEPLMRSLHSVVSGPLGSVFARPTTQRIRLDASAVCLDVSGVNAMDSMLQAAVLLSCWSEGFGAVEAANALTDAGAVTETGDRVKQSRWLVVLDELWRVLRAGDGMVDHVDSITRLNRNIGVGQILITHSMKDLRALRTEDDREKAKGFIERAGLVACGGLPMQELRELTDIVSFTRAEATTVSSWSTPQGWDRNLAPPGLGKFLLKCGQRPGVPVQVTLTTAELAAGVHDTNKRWAA